MKDKNRNIIYGAFWVADINSSGYQVHDVTCAAMVGLKCDLTFTSRKAAEEWVQTENKACENSISDYYEELGY